MKLPALWIFPLTQLPPLPVCPSEIEGLGAARARESKPQALSIMNDFDSIEKDLKALPPSLPLHL